MIVLAMSPRPPGDVPDLPQASRHGLHHLVVADSGSTLRAGQALDKPSARKRVVRERPARMIDDAVRMRAREAVQRALAEEEWPV